MIQLYDWCISCNLFDTMGGCAKCGGPVCAQCQAIHEEVCTGER